MFKNVNMELVYTKKLHKGCRNSVCTGVPVVFGGIL